MSCLMALGILTHAPAPSAAAEGKQKRPGLRFGIYPGGGVGSVNKTLEARPEDPAERLAALKQLSSGNPLVIRLYTAYPGPGPFRDPDPWLEGEIAEYTEAGFGIELVARYRAESAGGSGVIDGFSDFVRSLVQQYGSNPKFVSLQVTNEANLAGAPDASDGAYSSAIPALVHGVKAADQAARSTGASQLGIGFNWAFESSGNRRRGFWKELGSMTGSRFTSAVDWVGLNSYPGTWSPVKTRSGGKTLLNHLQTLRRKLMPRAGLKFGTAINITENGWPTGPDRSEATQASYLRSMVSSVAKAQRRLNVSDYRWFDLRDGNSDDQNFENHYGVTDDQYGPKPAFYVFRNQIARWSVRR